MPWYALRVYDLLDTAKKTPRKSRKSDLKLTHKVNSEEILLEKSENTAENGTDLENGTINSIPFKEFQKMSRGSTWPSITVETQGGDIMKTRDTEDAKDLKDNTESEVKSAEIWSDPFRKKTNDKKLGGKPAKNPYSNQTGDYIISCLKRHEASKKINGKGRKTQRTDITEVGNLIQIATKELVPEEGFKDGERQLDTTGKCNGKRHIDFSSRGLTLDLSSLIFLNVTWICQCYIGWWEV